MNSEEPFSTTEAAAAEVSEQKSALELFEQGMMQGTKKAMKHLSRSERHALDNKRAAERNALAKRRAKDTAAKAARKRNRP